MKYKLKVYSIWEVGRRKDSRGNPHQEDNMFPEYGRQSDSDRLFILCDGMGGHSAGEVASSTVCEAMSRSILGDGHDREGVFTREDLTRAINAAFDALDLRDNGAEKKMGTTLTFLKLHSKGATIAHMGDSRVYHIRPGKTGPETRIIFETEDHSLVNDLVKIGELTKEEARFSRQRNVITRAMQPNMGRRPRADVYETANIRPGDYFYMCSDGMLEQPEMDSGKSLRNIFSAEGGPDEDKVEILKSVTEKNRDNHTAFIIHILDVEDPLPVSGDDRAADDKFAAIVEDDITPVRPQAEGGQNPPEWRDDITILGNEPMDATGKRRPGKRGAAMRPAGKKPAGGVLKYVVLLLAAALVVLAVILGVNYFSGNGKDSGKDEKEYIKDSGDNAPSPLRSPDLPSKTEPRPSDAAPADGARQTAVEAANSASASNLSGAGTSKDASPDADTGTAASPDDDGSGASAQNAEVENGDMEE